MNKARGGGIRMSNRILKGICGWAVMLAGICTTFGDELAVSPIRLMEEPPLTENLPQFGGYRSVGASGTNGVFVWNKSAGDGTTNIFLTQVDEFGHPVGSPHFVAPEFYASDAAELYPAGDGFFMQYFDRRGPTSAARYLATRINLEGKTAFAPVVISTNNFKKSNSVSSGNSLLSLVENYRSVIRLDYTLLNWSGGIISTGTLEGASGGHSFATASDGHDFLVVWSASTAPYLRATRISGSDGSLSTRGLGANTMSVQTMAHGKNGYLAVGGQSLLQLSEDGTVLAKGSTSMPNISQGELLFAEGEGWILFASDELGTLRSFRITPGSGGFTVKADPYPPLQGIDSTLVPYGGVAPFGPGRFLVARTNGVSVLTSASASPAASAPIHADQKDSAIVASPFGYLMTWTEHRDLGLSIRGLRSTPDGSALDDRSFEIGSYQSSRVGPISVVFDGQDYVAEWSLVGAPARFARISPQGSPNVYSQTVSIDPGATGIYLIAHKGELFACRGAATLVVPDVHVWRIANDGQAGPEVIVHGYGAFSDGTDLFAIGVFNQSDVYKVAIDPDAAKPEINSMTIATGVYAKIAGLRHGVVVQWFDGSGNSTFAYFFNGQERLRTNAPKNVTVSFADSEERLLMAALPTDRGLASFTSFNLQTGDRSTVQADLGNVSSLRLASAGFDFLGMAESRFIESQRVEKFWVTSASAPVLGELKVSENIFSTTFNLNPQRHYRIEVSNDLSSWNLAQTISGLTNANYGISASLQAFVRAVLVPQ